MVRKLKGPVKKESKEERRQRRQENADGKDKIWSVAVPALLGVVVLFLVILWLTSSATPST